MLLISISEIVFDLFFTVYLFNKYEDSTFPTYENDIDFNSTFLSL